MHVELKPETRSIIEQDVRSGPYTNAEDFVEQAVAMLHEQEEWFAVNRVEIGARIEAGYASAERGELAGEGDVRRRLEARKREWLASQTTSQPI